MNNEKPKKAPHTTDMWHEPGARVPERVENKIPKLQSRGNSSSASIMEDFIFEGNSRAMFDQVCQATPWFVRHFTRNVLVKGLKSHGCGTVTEDLMYKVCREVTPSQHLDKTLKILDENKTNS